MFFSKIFSFGPKKEELIYENTKFRMLNTTIDNKKVTKFIYKESVKQYNLVKNIHHDNLISLIKINIKSNTFYTQPLIPFIKVYKSSTLEFNKHLFLCLANAIEFLHSKCNIVHNNIETDSLFFTEDGKIVLGGFEKSNISDYHDSDNIQFSNLLQKYLKISTNLKDYLQDNETKSRYFYDNEIFFFGFEAHSLEQKKDFLRVVKKKKDEFVEIYKKKIILVFLQDLSKDYDKFYKEDILNMIFGLDLCSYDDILPLLFNILDSNVRLMLFKNAKQFIGKIENIDQCLDSILLGLKIRKNDLRKETINFLKCNSKKCTDISKIKILENMYEVITEPEDILLVIRYINDTRPIFKESEIIYVICKKYLTIPGCRDETLKIIQVFYPTFNKHKVSTELLPLICTYLADEKLQSPTFLLIEDILADLKCHKEKIISKEWSFTDFFQNKKNLKSKSMENITEKVKQDLEVKQDSEDEWDDDW